MISIDDIEIGQMYTYKGERALVTDIVKVEDEGWRKYGESHWTRRVEVHWVDSGCYSLLRARDLDT